MAKSRDEMESATSVPQTNAGVDRAYAEHKAAEMGVRAEDILAAIKGLKDKPPSAVQGPTVKDWLSTPEPETVFYRITAFENHITGKPLIREVGRPKFRKEDGVTERTREKVRLVFAPINNASDAIFLGFPVLRFDVAEAKGMAITPEDVVRYPNAKVNALAEKTEFYNLTRAMEILPQERWFAKEREQKLVFTAEEFRKIVKARYDSFTSEVRSWEESGRIGQRPKLRPYVPKDFGIDDMCMDRPPNVTTGGLILIEPGGKQTAMEAMR